MSATIFPPVDQANDQGLLAIGDHLDPELVLNAYQHGIFPWYGVDQPVCWWSPDPRAVFNLDALKPARSLARTIRRAEYGVSFNRAFDQVIDQCAHVKRQRQDGTWLVPKMIATYCQLFTMGRAYSCEIWQHGKLVGGLYGVPMGCVFSGESMFSLIRDGSKLALFHMAQWLRLQGYRWLDAQVPSPHITSLGAIAMPRKQFIPLLTQPRALSR